LSEGGEKSLFEVSDDFCRGKELNEGSSGKQGELKNVKKRFVEAQESTLAEKASCRNLGGMFTCVRRAKVAKELRGAMGSG